MKTDSPGKRRGSRGWCQEILRVMNWNLLIKDWKIQPEPDPIWEYFREGQAGGRVDAAAVYLPGSCAHLKWRKPWHLVWGRKGKQMLAGQEVGCMRSASQGRSLQVTRVWKGAPMTWRPHVGTPQSTELSPVHPQDSTQALEICTWSQSGIWILLPPI